jgi:hypothetical protein
VKIPRQFPLFLVVEVRLRAGKSVGNVEMDFVTSREKELAGTQSLYMPFKIVHCLSKL